jgi:hypothetical protein
MSSPTKSNSASTPPPPIPVPVVEGERGDQARHTPGPWSIENDETIVTDAPGYRPSRIVCEVLPFSSSIRTSANAHLIAAAPELLAALHEMTETYWGVADDKNGDGGEPPSMVVRARAALAKARAA